MKAFDKVKYILFKDDGNVDSTEWFARTILQTVLVSIALVLGSIVAGPLFYASAGGEKVTVLRLLSESITLAYAIGRVYLMGVAALAVLQLILTHSFAKSKWYILHLILTGVILLVLRVIF